MYDDLIEEMCEFCEDNILNCNKSTITFLCEGCKCGVAEEMFMETDRYIEYHKEASRKAKFKILLNE